MVAQDRPVLQYQRKRSMGGEAEAVTILRVLEKANTFAAQAHTFAG